MAKNLNKIISVLIIINTISFSIFASVTKVGNGDDGGDLEKLVQINSGPLVSSKKKAIKLLDKLNIVGVPGLGRLISELEDSKMYLASEDVHPTIEPKGSLEISDDYKIVYARTFAEPNAITRFFPAAKKLSLDQLVALHIHEALHRSLPENIRTNENIVAHFTMAITSHGASFDRLLEVSKQYINISETRADQKLIQTNESNIKLSVLNKSKTSFKYTSVSYSFNDDGISGANNNLNILEFTTSPIGYQIIYGKPIEYIFNSRTMIDTSKEKKIIIGVVSLQLDGAILMEENKHIGPFLRYTTEAINKKDIDNSENIGRDFLTIGGFYKFKSDDSYAKFIFGYSTESTQHGQFSNKKYNSIVSFWNEYGLFYKNFSYGLMTDFYSGGGGDVVAPSKLIVAGPKVGYENHNFSGQLFYKTIVNDSDGNLDTLGDIMDHGSARVGLGVSLSILF